MPTWSSGDGGADGGSGKWVRDAVTLAVRDGIILQGMYRSALHAWPLLIPGV